MTWSFGVEVPDGYDVYLVIAGAIRRNGAGSQVVTDAFLFCGRSTDEAIGHYVARDSYPAQDGWSPLNVSAVSVSESLKALKGGHAIVRLDK